MDMVKVRLKLDADGNRKLVGHGRYEIGKNSFVDVPEEIALQCEQDGIYEVQWDKRPEIRLPGQ